MTDVFNVGVNGVSVTAVFNGNYYYGFSDTTGQYTITSLPAGNHLVYTYKNGYTSDTLNVTVSQGDTVQADFQIEQTYWYRLNSTTLQAANSYQNLYINPSQVIFASNRPGSWIGYNLGGFIKTSNLGDNWQSAISNGSATQIFPIADNNLFIFTAMGQDGLGHYIGENKLYRSGDYGATWQEQIDLNLEQIDGHKLVGMNNSTLFLNMYGWNNSSHYFHFYKSVNQGGSWTSYSPVSQYNVSGLNKTSSGKIYIADYSDSMYYSTNGNDWTKRVVTSSFRSYIINSVTLPTGEMVSNAGTSGYVISYDDGQNWSTLSTNITYFPRPNQFRFNSNNEIVSIVNNESNNAYGIYKSIDKCQTWQLIDGGLPEGYRPVSLALLQDYAYLLLNDGYLYKTSRATTGSLSDNKNTININKFSQKK
ncbi:MAG: carboxypeptidase regulatory-like domain-containing protein [Ignavibacteria bacterium]|nr:carboxypeptidase regulatory-like domain-containing protein [Ignavibacteria bacterium]